MKLGRKKELASRALGVGKKRIVFSTEGVNEIKEAITKQDIKDLVSEGIIKVKNPSGRLSKTAGKKRKKRKTPGNIKKKVNKRKQEYVALVRKLRKYIKELRKQGKINREEYIDLRKKIKNKYFKSKSNLKRYLEETLEKDLRK